MIQETSNKRLLIFITVWWIIVACIHAIIIAQTGFSYVDVSIDTIISFVFLYAATILIINNMRFYLPKQENYWYIFIVSLGISVVCTFLAKATITLFLKNDTTYIQFLNNSTTVRFGIYVLLVCVVIMISLLWYNQEEQKQMNAHKVEAEKLTREAELFKLRQQLQPHFLFNSLNSISALTGSQPEKARHMINQLSEFLRGTLKKDEKQWNTLEEELQYLQLYLDIEKVRFGYRLQTRVDCEEEVMQFTLPAMLLQPVVENAIKFGLYDTMGEVLITIDARQQQKFLLITVTNPFDAETSVPLKGTGFGLSSIKRRLFLMFARQDLLKTETVNDKFITTILIPQNT